MAFPSKRTPPLGPPKPTARQRVLTAWHGADLAPLEKARALTAKPAAAVVPQALSNIRFDRRRAEAEIVRVWNDLLDPNIGDR